MASSSPSSERYAQAKQIFLKACDLPATEHQAFLDQACGEDPALRQEVEDLLFHHEGATVPSVSEDPPQPATTTLPARFAAGDIFFERYRIVASLGRGGMGEVYRAHDLVLDEPVALKFVQPGSHRLEQILNEVRLARQITHPNVCRVFDIGEVGGEYFFSMEYIDGEDLRSLLQRIGRLPQDKVLDVARQLLAGLAAAHARGILHRDLKPANIMIDGRGRVRITDFGIAVGGGDGRRATPAGTPAYMAPEQLAGDAASEQSDLYSLSLVLYEMVTGRPAFDADQIRDFLEFRLTAYPEAPGDLVSELDPQLERVILQGLHREPRERPSSALVMAASLPGADPLAVALEAGATPAPEVVAAAGRDGALGPAQALALLGLVLVLLAATLGLADAAFRLPEANLQKSPEVLADRAQEILRSLGYDEPEDRAWGFLEDLRRPDPEGSLLFWYRESPGPMLPVDIDNYLFGNATVDLVDPPLLEEDMRLVFLEPRGRFVYLEVVPPMEPDDADTPSETDWPHLLRLSGLDPEKLESTSPEIAPLFFADARKSWRGADPTRPQKSLEVDAASFQGQPIFFSLDAIEEELDEERADTLAEQWDLLVDFSRLLYLVPLLALPLAIGNLQNRRGDPRGARRLAAFILLTRALMWLLGASHLPTFYGEVTLFLGSLAAMLLEAALVWVSYLALEPYVRRLWPQTLIAWSRLFTGRWRDPLVGRSLLLGCAAGLFFTVLTQVDRLVPAHLGLASLLSPVDSAQLAPTLSTPQLLTMGLGQILSAIYAGIFALLLLVLLRFLLRRPHLAAVAFVLVVGTFEVLEGAHLGISALTLGLGVALPAVILLMRLGLLAYIVARCVQFLCLESPLTTDLSAWYATTGLAAIASVLVLSFFGFHTVLGGRPLFVEPTVTTERLT